MPEQKLHASCDECRRRKLRCTGEQPSCARCQDEAVTCNYSMRKTMGRPRKRHRGEDATEETSNVELGDSQTPEAKEHFAGMSVAFAAHGDWTLPPLEVASEHDDMLNVQYQHEACVNDGIDPNLAAYTSNLWDQGTGLLSPGYSALESPPCPLNRDVVPDSMALEEPKAVEGDQVPQNIIDTCTCLSTMYLAAANMESTRHSGFPTALTSLRAGLATTHGILVCTKCVKDAISGCQNIMLIHSLLHTMTIGFEKLLKDIDAEANRAIASSETKLLSAGDTSPAALHMHTGTPDCPARFELELEPHEWGKIAKRVVRKSIFASDDQWHTLEGLVDATEARQRAWHSRGFPKPLRKGPMPPEKDWTCLRMTGEVRRLISELSQL